MGTYVKDGNSCIGCQLLEEFPDKCAGCSNLKSNVELIKEVAIKTKPAPTQPAIGGNSGMSYTECGETEAVPAQLKDLISLLQSLREDFTDSMRWNNYKLLQSKVDAVIAKLSSTEDEDEPTLEPQYYKEGNKF